MMSLLQILQYTGILLMVLVVETINGATAFSNPEFEGRSIHDDCAELQNDHHYNMKTCISKSVHKNTSRYRRKRSDSEEYIESSSSSEEMNDAQHKNTTQGIDRKTLFQWYDYGYGLKELLNLIDEGAEKCGCAPMGKAVYYAQLKVNQALNSVSIQLRYGTRRQPEYVSKESPDDDDES